MKPAVGVVQQGQITREQHHWSQRPGQSHGQRQGAVDAGGTAEAETAAITAGGTAPEQPILLTPTDLHGTCQTAAGSSPAWHSGKASQWSNILILVFEQN